VFPISFAVLERLPKPLFAIEGFVFLCFQCFYSKEWVGAVSSTRVVAAGRNNLLNFFVCCAGV